MYLLDIKIGSPKAFGFSTMLSVNWALVIEPPSTFGTNLSNSLGFSLKYSAGEMDIEEDLKNYTISKSNVPETRKRQELDHPSPILLTSSTRVLSRS